MSTETRNPGWEKAVEGWHHQTPESGGGGGPTDVQIVSVEAAKRCMTGLKRETHGAGCGLSQSPLCSLAPRIFEWILKRIR